MKDISEDGFVCLQSAITIARNQQIRRLEALKKALLDHGFSKDVVEEAVLFWADYEAVKDRAMKAA